MTSFTSPDSKDHNTPKQEQDNTNITDFLPPTFVGQARPLLDSTEHEDATSRSLTVPQDLDAFYTLLLETPEDVAQDFLDSINLDAIIDDGSDLPPKSDDVPTFSFDQPLVDDLVENAADFPANVTPDDLPTPTENPPSSEPNAFWTDDFSKPSSDSFDPLSDVTDITITQPDWMRSSEQRPTPAEPLTTAYDLIHTSHKGSLWLFEQQSPLFVFDLFWPSHLLPEAIELPSDQWSFVIPYLIDPDHHSLFNALIETPENYRIVLFPYSTPDYDQQSTGNDLAPTRPAQTAF